MRLHTFFISVWLFLFGIFTQCPTSAVPISAPTQDAPASPVLNTRDLNPAFKLSQSEMDKAILKGQSFAQKGKTFQDLLKDNTQMPIGVKGEKGKSHESRIVFMTINGLTTSFLAYQAANRYEALPKSTLDGYYERNAEFFVELKSVPKVASNIFGRNRSADQNDVSVDKFVLTDDKGNVFQPSGTVPSGVRSGIMNFSGKSQVYHQDIENVHVDTSTSTSNTSTWSTTTSGTATGTVTHNWIERIPWSENHPYYSATYSILFPLFDKDGQPFIKADVKFITLHIITPNGEKAVIYDLKPPKI